MGNTMKKAGLLVWILLLILGGIFLYQRSQASLYSPEEEEPKIMSYRSITMEEAKALFEEAGEYVILDVRRPDEFASGHIPGAINIPNETIGGSCPAELPDQGQLIYVYCRSGNRSKQASAKLIGLGYTNIVEFGGILDWTGEME